MCPYIVERFCNVLYYALSMIVTVGGIKGGSGKSTLATHLAVMHGALGMSTLLMDTDVQQTSTSFSTLRTERFGLLTYTSTRQSGPSVLAAARDFGERFDVVIIDAGGKDSKAQRAALIASDAAWFPFVPQPFDTWTAEPLMELLAEVRQVNPSLISFSYINRADLQSPMLERTQVMLRELSEHGLAYSGAVLARRAAFATAPGFGLVVSEQKPRNMRAVNEMTTLFNLVRGSASFGRKLHHAQNVAESQNSSTGKALKG